MQVTNYQIVETDFDFPSVTKKERMGEKCMLIVKVDSSIAERVLRERWVEQARDLYAKKYGQAA